ncbi:MAG: cardiolipin synthase [Planctomycetes bacterium]|nr:cardiolipin synthase [Planctomycetota bacterium]MCL4731207.1 cardiolipin synthase [Planctomycetota bacterium]
MEAILTAAGVALYYTVMVLSVIWVFARKRDPASAVSWSLAILFVPVAGLAVFLLLGRDRLPWRLKRKLRHRPEFARRMARFIPARGEGSREGFQGIGRLAEQTGNSPIREGNKLTGLLEGPEAFEAIHEAIAGARHHVHVEEYIFRDDSLGRKLLELLCKRAREGVQVRLLVDAVGTGAARRLIRDLRRAGGRGAVFLPMFPLGKTLTPNLRNHRKIIVCDGRVGFLGGMNVGDEYFGLKLRNRYWCDWHLRIEGPAVSDLQRVFVEDWDFATGRELAAPEYFPNPEPCGESRVQIVHSGPDEEVNSTRQVFFAAITRAQHRVSISSPYFVPDPAIREALRNAALRGVRVEVLTQGWPPEMYTTYFASRYYWEEFLHCGVRIFEYRHKVLHGKGMIVDSEWAAVGSSNLDPRSMQLNFEVLGLLDSPQDAAFCQEHLDRMIAQSVAVTPEMLARRGLVARAAESTARLFGPLL